MMIIRNEKLNQQENHQWGNSEAYLGPGLTSTMELFGENS